MRNALSFEGYKILFEICVLLYDYDFETDSP